jgi:HAD superfamily hydrolase (TIGR01456 family)
MSFGIAFDIDGVLWRDERLIKGADDCVKRVLKAGWNRLCVFQIEENLLGLPCVFITNGGGMPESVKRDALVHSLGLSDLSVEHVIMPHTAFKPWLETNRHNINDGKGHVLIVGLSSERARKCATSYGLHAESLVTVNELLDNFPHFVQPSERTPLQMQVYKDKSLGTREAVRSLKWPYRFRGVLIFEEPSSYVAAMQVITDIVNGRNGNAFDQYTPEADGDSKADAPVKQEIPILLANPDLTYGGAFLYPRFTCGSFGLALETLFHAHTGRKLHIDYFGKPLRATFAYAESALLAQCQRDRRTLTRCYMIGDNPKSDIKGANDMGEKWRSILVRTGCFVAQSANDATNPAWRVCDDVVAAMQIIVQCENFHF